MINETELEELREYLRKKTEDSGKTVNPYNATAEEIMKYVTEQPYIDLMVKYLVSVSSRPRLKTLIESSYIKPEIIDRVGKEDPYIYNLIPESAYDKEINELQDFIYSRVKKGRRNIDFISNQSIALYLDEQPYKNELIKYYVKKNSSYRIFGLCELSYITIKDILEVEKEYPEIYGMIPESHYEKYPELCESLIKNENVLYDILPKSIREREDIKQALKREKKIYSHKLIDKKGYNLEWLDKDENLKEFFKLEANYPIESKDDYLKIVELYLSSDMSVPSFCNKYGIKDYDGFNKLLERVGTENTDTDKEIDTVKDNAKKRYVVNTKRIAKEIEEGQLLFEDIITEQYNPYLRFKLLYNYSNDTNKLMNQVIDYIEKNKYTLMHKRLINMFDTDSKEILKEIRFYTNMSGIPTQELYRRIKGIMDMYNVEYKRKQILNCSVTQNGETRTLDDDVIDEALTYLKDNKYDVCSANMQYFAKEIAFGRHSYKEATNAKKEELRENIIKLALEKANSIEDYFRVMEENEIGKTR